jgi:mRNA-degrading endonuclease RelE of RelBE toxin-antitoxin system
MYNVVVIENVLKKLQTFHREDRLSFYSKLEMISENPFANIPFVKRLKNSRNFRFRFGNYRCVYHVESKTQIITVIDIDHRKEIYRRKK